jgi:hypothetical protein
MTTAEWVEKFRGEGIEIEIKKKVCGSDFNAAYFWESDRIELTPNETTTGLFHELSHWTGNPIRLDREFAHGRWGDREILMKEECVAWEATLQLADHLRFDMGEEDLDLWAMGCRKLKGPYPKEEGCAAANFIIERFGL